MADLWPPDCERRLVSRPLICGCYSSPRKLTYLVPQSPRTAEAQLPPSRGRRTATSCRAHLAALQACARATPSQSDAISPWVRVTGDTQQAGVQTWWPFSLLKEKLANFMTSNDIILLISAIKAELKGQSARSIKRCLDSGDEEGLARRTGDSLTAALPSGSAGSRTAVPTVLPHPLYTTLPRRLGAHTARELHPPDSGITNDCT